MNRHMNPAKWTEVHLSTPPRFPSGGRTNLPNPVGVRRVYRPHNIQPINPNKTQLGLWGSLVHPCGFGSHRLRFESGRAHFSFFVRTKSHSRIRTLVSWGRVYPFSVSVPKIGKMISVIFPRRIRAGPLYLFSFNDQEYYL